MKKNKSTYYKRRYGIGIYKKIMRVGETDEMVALFDTAEEFANFMGKSIKKAYDILRNHFKKNQKYIYVKDEIYELAFIDMVEEL